MEQWSAGHGAVAANLKAGIPLLLLPINLEQHLTARRVIQLRAGLAVGDTELNPDYAGLLARLLVHLGYRESAKAFAERHREDTQDRLQDRILIRIGELAACARLEISATDSVCVRKSAEMSRNSRLSKSAIQVASLDSSE